MQRKDGSLRVALYARVSKDEAARDANSLAKQIDAGRAEVERMKFRGDSARVVVEFRDDGISGGTSFEDRPGGAQLLQAAEAGEIDAVVFFALDRFTRKAIKGLKDFEHMEDDLGLSLVFVKENVDTSQPSGRLFRTILAAFAEFERDTITDRTSSGRRSSTKRHLDSETGRVKRWTMGGEPPYGYRINDAKEIEVDPYEAEIVRRAFELRGQGLNQLRIAERLKDEGYKTRARRPRKSKADRAREARGERIELLPEQGDFTRKAVNSILNNRAYLGEGIVYIGKGKVHDEGEVIVYEAPKIITEAEWARALAHKPEPRVEPEKNEKVNAYALGGRIVHQHADGSTATMFGQAKKLKSGGLTRYYRCNASRTDTTTGADPFCDGFGQRGKLQRATSIQADIVEARVLKALLDTKADEFLAHWDKQHDAYLKGTGTDSLAEDAAQLAKLRRRLDRLADERTDAEDDEDIASVERRIVDTKAGIEALRERVETAESAAATREALAASLASLPTLDELLAAEIMDSPGYDPVLDATVTPRDALEGVGSGPGLLDLCDAIEKAVRNGDRYVPRFPEWAVKVAAETFTLWGVEATLWEKVGDPRDPEIEVSLGRVGQRYTKGRASLW
jgi:site-specific DNA recombinase